MNGELKACPKCHGTLEFLVDPSRPWDSASYRKCPDCHPAMKRPTPAPGALPELPPLPKPFDRIERSGMWNGAPREGFDDVFDDDQMHAYARAYAEQCRAVVVVTDAMVERSARKVCEIAMQDWDDIGPFAQSVLMDTQRAALQSAFADDEGVKRGDEG